MRKGSNATPAFLVLLALVVGSCGDKDEPCLTCPTTSDTTSPEINDVSPEDGTVGVPVTSVVITVTFSELVDPTTVNASTFMLTNAVAVAGEITVNGAVATFTPETPLEYSALHAAVVTTGVKDMAGNALSSDYEWSFETEVSPDTTPTPWVVLGNYVVGLVAVDATGIYVAGRSTTPGNHDSFNAAFTTSGQRTWLEEVSTADHCNIPIGVAVARGYVYTVRAEDPFPCMGRANIYLDVQVDTSGALVRSTLVAENTWARDLAVDDEGNAYVVILPTELKQVSPDGSTVQTVVDWGEYSSTSMSSVYVDETSVYVSGMTLSSVGGPNVSGYNDILVARYARLSFNQVWLEQYGDYGAPQRDGIVNGGMLRVSAEAGVVYLGAGYIDWSQGPTFWPLILAYDTTGALLWHRNEGGIVKGIAVDQNGNAYTVGMTANSPLKISPSGEVVWVASPPLEATAVAVSDGTVFVVDNTNVLARYDVATGVMK